MRLPPALLCALFLSPGLAAPEAEGRLSATEEQAAREAVRRLASDDFSSRETATQALRELGWRALPLLEEASRSTDLEVRTRAERLISAIEWTRPEAGRLWDRLAPGVWARHFSDQFRSEEVMRFRKEGDGRFRRGTSSFGSGFVRTSAQEDEVTWLPKAGMARFGNCRIAWDDLVDLPRIEPAESGGRFEPPDGVTRVPYGGAWLLPSTGVHPDGEEKTGTNDGNGESGYMKDLFGRMDPAGLRSEDPLKRRRTAFALGAWAECSGKEGRSNLEALGHAIRDADPGVRAVAACAYVRLRDRRASYADDAPLRFPEDPPAELLALLSEDGLRLRALAAEAIGRMAWRGEAVHLLTSLENPDGSRKDPPPWMIARGGPDVVKRLEQAASARDPEWIGRLDACLKDPDASVRAEAARAIQLIRGGAK